MVNATACGGNEMKVNLVTCIILGHHIQSEGMDWNA